jgi:hypothetical protein
VQVIWLKQQGDWKLWTGSMWEEVVMEVLS